MSLSPDEIKNIARVVLEVIDEQRPAPAARGRAARLWGWIADHPTIPFATATAVAVLLLAHFVYGVEYGTALSEMSRDYRHAQERSDLVESHLALGNDFLKVENLPAARAEFDQALALEPTNPSARRGLFIASIFDPLAGGEYDAEVAGKRLDFLFNEDREDPVLLMLTGHAHLFNNQLDAALDSYDHALQNDDKLAGAYEGKASVFSQRSQHAQALKMHEKALELSPGNVRYLHNYAGDLYHARRYRDALEQLSTASLYSPKLVPTHLDMGLVYRYLGEYANAISHYQTAVRLLADERTAASDLNSRRWTYLLEHMPAVGNTQNPALVEVDDRPEKRYLAHVQLALTLSLREAKRRAVSQLTQAQRLQLSPADMRNVDRLVLDQMTALERKQPRLSARLNAFRSLLRASHASA